MTKKIIVEVNDAITLIECYGDEFPLHQEEWETHHSFWQEDYVRFLFQTDIGALTIYDGNYDLTLLWGQYIWNVEDFYDLLKKDILPGEVYGDDRFQAAYQTKNGQSKNVYLDHIHDVFTEVYETLFKQGTTRNELYLGE